LQAEDEQERSDDEPEHLDRDHVRAAARRRDDGGERDRCGARPDERRPPPAEAHCEHDRERFDRLDCAREERGKNEKDVGQE
jgi:hypothetical protein